jgi:outer membrane protein insertion porin family
MAKRASDLTHRNRTGRCLGVLVAAFVFGATAFADSPKIVEIRVEGNHAVQAEAVVGLMNSRVGGILSTSDIRSDIRAIYRSGFFQDVRIDHLDDANGLVLVVSVVEKPIISDIQYEGFREVPSSSIGEKLLTKRYTIVDEKKLNGDVRTIEQMYVEKGYYLARVNYEQRSTASGEVVLVFKVTENNPVALGRISIMGNSRFSDSELKNGMLLGEKRWGSFLNSTGIFRDEFVARDKEFLSFLYKDNGYIEADVSSPQSRLSPTRQRVDVSFNVEEGQMYNVGKISFAGDLIIPQENLREKLSLKERALFRISQFQNDVKTLTDLFGDEGYAFVDIVPETTTHREDRVVDITWKITKGEKAYFRNITIEGNDKTRDNVIRRNIRVSEGERFHATRLEKSREAIERLGFFQEVQVQRVPDAKNNVVDLRVKVKEKPTGSLNASIGAIPAANGVVNFQFQGAYNEGNFMGKGWDSSLTGNLTKTDASENPNWGLDVRFTEPSINDSAWSITTYGKFDFEYIRPVKSEPERVSRRLRGGVSLGRELFEDLRLNLGYSYERVRTDNINPVFAFVTEQGDTERVSQSLTYDRTNNFRMPTSGYYASASNILAISAFGGDYSFGKSDFSAVYYLPLNFSDDFQSNFRFAFEPGFVYSITDTRVPIWERLKLGGQYNMRGYQRSPISPRRMMIESPSALAPESIPVGGMTRIYGSAEYFIPLIQEANLRLVTFAESGTILGETEKFSFDKLRHDVGMGIRWMTPIAPFRFEWAWQLEKGKLGKGDFVFTIGFDNAAAF